MPLVHAAGSIRVIPLGAGQDVGRSCVLVMMGGKTIMFDCGMHMGYNDSRRFPDFSVVAAEGPLTPHIDCAIISHFHLDHCGALPYFSEMRGYDGPIYMTYPTKAICPLLLEDYRKITVEKRGGGGPGGRGGHRGDQETTVEGFFTAQMIKDCMKKVVAVDVHQTVHVDDNIEIKAYYAGHVLGAAMFYVRVGTQSVLYTGDYNMTPDRHLGAAWVDRCLPDVVITESTYATTIRDSKRCRERDFLSKVHRCVQNGGKVLIPVFALGRAQELCILLETYWERNNLTVPIFFSAGLTEKATEYYKLFITWTNQMLKDSFVDRNMFDFKHIKPFDRAYADLPGPQVLFATPGMLHAGLSLHVFLKWAPDPRNMVILPGYCVAGTVGAKVIAGQKRIEVDRSTVVDVRLAVEHLSFSAHADAKGILQLIKQSGARHVILVHGEAEKMAFLAQRINKELGLPCDYPANGHIVEIAVRNALPMEFSTEFLSAVPDPTTQSIPVSGVLVKAQEGPLRLLTHEQARRLLGVESHRITYRDVLNLRRIGDQQAEVTHNQAKQALHDTAAEFEVAIRADGEHSASLRSITIDYSNLAATELSWEYPDDALAHAVMDSWRARLRVQAQPSASTMTAAMQPSVVA